MDWKSLLECNINVVIGGCFTILGVIIAWLLNLIQSYFQNKKEQKKHLQEKREEFYVESLKCILRVMASIDFIKQGVLSDEIKLNINNLAAPMKIYATKDVWNYYHSISQDIRNNNISVEIKNKLDKMVDSIKFELGIKK